MARKFAFNKPRPAHRVDGLTESGVSPPQAMSFQRQWCGVWRLQPDVPCGSIPVPFSRVWVRRHTCTAREVPAPRDQASVPSVGIPPSGVNVARWSMRSLRTHGALAPVECQIEMPLSMGRVSRLVTPYQSETGSFSLDVGYNVSRS
jgi:hypothetical protein